MSRHVTRPFGIERKIIFQRFSMFFLCSTALDVLLAQNTSQPQVNSETSSTTFCCKTDPSGTELCARDNPSVVYNSSQLDEPYAGARCVPGSVLCAWKCKMDKTCISFNWKYDIQLCEVFYFVPVSYNFVPGCEFRQVGNYSIHFPLLPSTQK